MSDPASGAGHQAAEPLNHGEVREQGPTLIDGIRFLYVRRLRLAAYFLVFFSICAAIYLNSYLRAPKVVEGVVGLSFRGIERHEYPSGKKFTLEDFRSPDLLGRTLAEAGISENALGVRDFAARMDITPIIPAEIQSRWKKAEKDGTRREDYYPNEFKISIEGSELNSAQELRLFGTLVKMYQQRAKFEQNAALSFVSTSSLSYEEIAKAYDFWDIPNLFRDTYNSIASRLEAQIKESLQASETRYQLSFRDLSKDLEVWEQTRLEALEALTYQGRLVKNRDIVERRILYRIEELNIRIKQRADEITDATRLLEIVDRPKAILAGQLNNREFVPLVDAGTLERLVKSDYIGPVVTRIMQLQADAKSWEAERARLQKQMQSLPRATNISLEQIPSGYRELINTLSSELQTIVAKYNRLLDEYLTATVSSLVSIRQSPIVTRSVGFSLPLVLASMFVVSLFLAIAMLAIEAIMRSVRAQVSK